MFKHFSLAASQGVIRADDQRQFILAVNRLEALLIGEHTSSRQFLVEQFVSGPEVALEGMLTRGELRVLALFDKPDPLDGPDYPPAFVPG